MQRRLTIGELAAELGITTRTVRFYEDEGLISPAREGTARAYDARDRARMILILRGKRLGFRLREIRDYLDLYRAGRDNAAQWHLLLRGVRARLDDLAAQRAALDDAVAELEAIENEAHAALRNCTLEEIP